MRPKQFTACKFCQKKFEKRAKSTIYCSRSCQTKHLRKIGIIKNKPKNGENKKCIVCESIFYVPAYRAKKEGCKFCSRNCLAKHHLKKFSLKYGFKKTGTAPRKYKQVISFGRQTRLHRAVMENFLGRKLTREEHVHHIDGNPQNNSLENLMIVSNSEHGKLSYLERLRLD